MGAANWKEALGDRIPKELGVEIDVFETQIALRRQGKLDEKVFAETRLSCGVYGQRYDNGRRHDGIESRTLNYPSGDLVKGMRFFSTGSPSADPHSLVPRIGTTQYTTVCRPTIPPFALRERSFAVHSQQPSVSGTFTKNC